MIFRGKYRTIPGFMFSDSPSQVICNTDVQRRIVVAGHYVNVISLVHRVIIRFFELRSQNDRGKQNDWKNKIDRSISIATPCSVKAKGGYLGYLPFEDSFKVTNCDLKLVFNDLYSSSDNVNIKSSGNRSRFLRTACFKALVSTWYNFARSKSSITFFPRISWIRS